MGCSRRHQDGIPPYIESRKRFESSWGKASGRSRGLEERGEKVDRGRLKIEKRKGRRREVWPPNSTRPILQTQKIILKRKRLWKSYYRASERR